MGYYQSIEKRKAYNRFKMFGSRCECNYPDHNHDSKHDDKEVKRAYPHGRYGIDPKELYTENEIIWVCYSCHQQIQTPKSKIYE